MIGWCCAGCNEVEQVPSASLLLLSGGWAAGCCRSRLAWSGCCCGVLTTARSLISVLVGAVAMGWAGQGWKNGAFEWNCAHAQGSSRPGAVWPTCVGRMHSRAQSACPAPHLFLKGTALRLLATAAAISAAATGAADAGLLCTVSQCCLPPAGSGAPKEGRWAALAARHRTVHRSSRSEWQTDLFSQSAFNACPLGCVGHQFRQSAQKSTYC